KVFVVLTRLLPAKISESPLEGGTPFVQLAAVCHLLSEPAPSHWKRVACAGSRLEANKSTENRTRRIKGRGAGCWVLLIGYAGSAASIERGWTPPTLPSGVF